MATQNIQLKDFKDDQTNKLRNMNTRVLLIKLKASGMGINECYVMFDFHKEDALSRNSYLFQPASLSPLSAQKRGYVANSRDDQTFLCSKGSAAARLSVDVALLSFPCFLLPLVENLQQYKKGLIPVTSSNIIMADDGCHHHTIQTRKPNR